jgi:hypothetical protein
MTMSYGYADSSVLVDLEMQCQDCGNAFWWTAGEQEFFQQRGYAPPKRCKACRDRKKARQSIHQQTSQALVPTRKPMALVPKTPALPALPEFPREFTDRAALFADIQELLKEATSPVVERQRTFWEWIRGVDVKSQQIADKMRAASTADELVKQRTRLFQHLQEMIAAATEAELARLQAHIRLQEAQLRAMELHEQIAQRKALAHTRLRTQQIREHADQRKLLKAAEEELPGDFEQAEINQHRRTLNAKVHSRQIVLSDFLQQVDRICRSRLTAHEKGLRIRAMLDSFEMNEDALPDEARRILYQTERFDDE